MEFLKHELFQNEPESGIRRSAAQYMVNATFQDERDDITRQRLIFTAILADHFEVLFNGTSNERGPLWEEIRQYMIEQGALTLVDKDWKYVASCYWQNIRKESIRRMAKMKVGAIKTARPGQLELDRLVGEVINKRGPGATSLETLVRNYGRNYTDEESPNQSGQAADIQLIHLEESVSKSASPAVPQEQMGNNQAALDQLVRSSRAREQRQPDSHQQACSSTSAMANSSSKAPQMEVSSQAQQQQENGNSSQLGKCVVKTHSQLVAGGYLEMAQEFEQQLKQLVNGYKAWMFDQLFHQGQEQGQGPPERKKRKQ